MVVFEREMLFNGGIVVFACGIVLKIVYETIGSVVSSLINWPNIVNLFCTGVPVGCSKLSTTFTGFDIFGLLEIIGFVMFILSFFVPEKEDM